MIASPALLIGYNVLKMYYVYFIKSKAESFTYVGSTADLKRRFAEHNQKQVLSTKSHAPFNLIYYEAYSNKTDAIKREHRLKHHGSVIGHLKKRCENSLKETI